MPGFNTTGAPNTRDYLLGRGIVLFKAVGEDTFRDLGNAPELVITMSRETLEHRSSRECVSFVDAQFVISQEAAIRLVLDEVNFDNLRDWTSGTGGTHTAPVNATFAAADNIITTAVELGRWYELYDDDGVRLYNLDKAALVYKFVEDPAGTPADLDPDNYEIDEVLGLVRFIPGGAAALAGTEAIGFAITTGAATATVLDEVHMLGRQTVEGTLLFLGVNAGDSCHKTEVRFHKVTLSAEGDFSLIGDEVAQMTFTGIAQADSTRPPGEQVATFRTFDPQ